MSSAFKNLKRWLLKVTELSAIELNGMLILLPLILLLVFSQPLFRVIVDKPLSLKRSMQLDSLLEQFTIAPVPLEEEPVQSNYLSTPFSFNPNDATYQDFIDLGFEPRIAARIIAYRNTGADFRYKEDLLRIHDIDSALALQLWNYILIPEKPRVDSPKKVKEEISYSLLDINNADTADLKTIKGIGTVLSSRIVAYRKSLGGFIHIDQLSEVYGLKPEIISSLKARFYIAEDYVPNKININSADETLLKRHPYIDSKSARAIITYRSQHGLFKSVEELRNIYLISDSSLVKILPYIDN